MAPGRTAPPSTICHRHLLASIPSLWLFLALYSFSCAQQSGNQCLQVPLMAHNKQKEATALWNQAVMGEGGSQVRRKERQEAI